MPFEIRLPGCQRCTLHQLAKAGEIARLRNDDGVNFAVEISRAQLRFPIVTGHQPGELGELEFIVGLDRIAIFDARPLHFGEFRFQREDFLRTRRCIFFTGSA